MNALEKVQLRKTIKIKEPELNNSVEETSTTSSSNIITNNQTNFNSLTNKLGNRFSMFEQQSAIFPNLKSNNLGKKVELTNNNGITFETSKITESNDENTLAQETTSSTINNKFSKPLPPVPPNKPPRPAFNQSISTSLAPNKPPAAKDEPQQPTMLVKLRPVQPNQIANNNSNSNFNSPNIIDKINITKFTNNDLNHSPNHNNLHLNNINVNKTSNNLIINENNIPVGINLANSAVENKISVISNGESNKVLNISEHKSNQRLSTQEAEKRASVRELVQMMFEESKVGL